MAHNVWIIDPLPLYRLAHALHRARIRIIPNLICNFNYLLTGAAIPPTVIIGRRVQFPDCGSGVVINGRTTIGDDVIIMPHVVLGQNVRARGEVVPAELIVGNGVVIGAGAKLIASGRLEIGDNAVIGANSVVLRSVPMNATAVGVPARVICDNLQSTS